MAVPRHGARDARGGGGGTRQKGRISKRGRGGSRARGVSNIWRRGREPPTLGLVRWDISPPPLLPLLPPLCSPHSSVSTLLVSAVPSLLRASVGFVEHRRRWPQRRSLRPRRHPAPSVLPPHASSSIPPSLNRKRAAPLTTFASAALATQLSSQTLSLSLTTHHILHNGRQTKRLRSRPSPGSCLGGSTRCPAPVLRRLAQPPQRATAP